VRDKWIHVKVSEDERQAWQAQAQSEGVTLADLIRSRLATATVGREPRRKRAARRADPALLAALARIGSNLNQIARWANTYKLAASVIPVMTTLVVLERAVRGVLVQHHGGSLSIAHDASAGATGPALASEDGVVEGQGEEQPEIFSLLPMQGQVSEEGVNHDD